MNHTELDGKTIGIFASRNPKELYKIRMISIIILEGGVQIE